MISEDNPVAWRVLNNFAQDISLLITNTDKTEQNIALRTVAAAILSNVPSLSSAYMNQIFETLNQALDINHRTLLGKCTSSMPLEEKNENPLDLQITGEEQMDEESDEHAARRRRKQDLPTEHDIEVKHMGWVLEAQRIAAETVTNLCSSDDNGNDFFHKEIINNNSYNSLIITNRIIFLFFFSDVDDGDDSSDAESVHDYDKDSSNSSAGLQADKLPIEILEPIKSLGLVEKLWQRAQPIAENVNNLLKESNKDLFKK